MSQASLRHRRTRSERLRAAAAAAGMLATGCAATGGATAGQTTEPASTAASTAVRSGTSAPVEEEATMAGMLPEGVLESIVADATRRAGVDATAVTVASTEPKVWSDGALGCPEPCKVYTQAVVQGWQVIVVADDRRYDYRIGRRGRFLLCQRTGAGGVIDAAGESTPRPFPSRPSNGS